MDRKTLWGPETDPHSASHQHNMRKKQRPSTGKRRRGLATPDV